MTEQEKRETVIKGLEGCFDALVQEEHALAENGVVMSSWQDRAKKIDAIREAIALLKAQEPAEPVFDAGDGKTIGQFLCGKCHAKIGFGHPHFCWYCGRAVKWE